MDIWDKKKRSEVMSKIRSKNTKPEMTLRKALFAKGYRYRINFKALPGRPDIVFPKYKTAIFVHGCFWHGHEGCRYHYTPKTNTDFWIEKIATNRNRDKQNNLQILSMGWKVLTIWECEIRQKDKIELLVDKVIQTMHDNIPYESEPVSVKLYEIREDIVTMVAEDTIIYHTKRKSNHRENLTD